MLEKAIRELLFPLFTALGVMLGGSIIGALPAVFTFASPLSTMLDMSRRIKIYAIVVAIGGTFPTFKLLESGIFEGNFAALGRQLLLIVSALLGAQLGAWIIKTMVGGN